MLDEEGGSVPGTCGRAALLPRADDDDDRDRRRGPIALRLINVAFGRLEVAGPFRGQRRRLSWQGRQGQM
jgi:hypothetical protein